MDIRGAWQALFGRPKRIAQVGWREIGSYNSVFAPYGGDIYANEIARAAIRTLAEQTSKANPRCEMDAKLERLLEYRPNLYMNGKDFLYKIRTRLELDNTCFVYINRDERGNVVSLYPVPSASWEALEAGGELYISFQFSGGGKLTAAWADLAVLRKDFNQSDIYGDRNTAIATSLDLLSTTSQGMANAIRSTANLRGLLKFTKGMLKPEDMKRQKDDFVLDYMKMENASGIVAVDSTMEYQQLRPEPLVADYLHVKELRDNIFRYFGVNEEAVTGKLMGDAWDAFYSASIEPFLIALGLELTYKIYTDRERGYGNRVFFESNRLQYMSMENKLKLIQLIDRKTLLPNELRAIMGLPRVPWGDEPLFWQDPKGEAGGEEAADGEDKEKGGEADGDQ